MTEFLHAILAYPTVLFTAVLGLAVLYWIGVIVGALDIDLFDGDAAAGALKAGAEGAADAVSGALKAGAEGAADAIAPEAADAVDVGDGPGGAFDLLGVLKLRDVPITVTLSLMALGGWVFSLFGMYLLAPVVPLPAWILGSIVLVGSIAAALPVASLLARPFGALFTTEAAQGRAALVGSTCTITTGRVDERFGQASVDDGQGGFLVPVRCATPNPLQRGATALIVDYDPRREVFSVEPLDPALEGADQKVRALRGVPNRTT